MNRRQQRLVVISVGGAVLAGAAFLTLSGLSSSVTYFYAPAEIASAKVGDRVVRLGGMVEAGSVRREGSLLFFTVTDGEAAPARVPVRFEGDPPDLFREAQGVVAEGRIQPDGSFLAERLLAKHDENYMPPEVARAKALAKERDAGETPYPSLVEGGA